MCAIHRHRLLEFMGVMTIPLLASCGVAYLLSPGSSMPAHTPLPNAEERADIQGQAPVQEQHAADGVQVVIPTPHTTAVTMIKVSANGRFVLSQDTTGATKLWDVAGRREIRTFVGVQAEFGSDGQVVIYDPRKGAVLYDPANDRQSMLVGTPAAEARRVTVANNGEIIVSADMRVAVSLELPTQTHCCGTWLKVSDLVEGKSFELKSRDEREIPTALNADGTILQSLAVLSEGGIEYQIWDLKTRTIRQRIPFNQQQVRPALSADGRLLLAQNLDCSVDIYDVRENLKRTIVPAPAVCDSAYLGIQSPVLSPHGTLLAHRTAHGIDIYEVSSGLKRQAIEVEQSRGIGRTDEVSFSADDKYLARKDQGARSQTSVDVWELASGRLLTTQKASALAFGHRDDSIVLGLSSGTLILQNLSGGQQVALGGGAGGVTELALTADARYLLAGSFTESARLWDLTTGQLKRNLDCPNGAAAISVSISSHAPLAAIGCKDGSAWLWDLKTGRQVGTLSPSTESNDARPASMAVRFSDDGQLVAVGHNEQVTVWSAGSNTRIRQFPLPRGALPAELQNAFSADSLKGSGIPAEFREQLLADKHRITSIAFQPRGHLIAIDQPYELSVWDIDAGRRVLDKAIGEHSIRRVKDMTDWRSLDDKVSVAFSADGRTLFADGKRFDVASGNEINAKHPEDEPGAPVITNHSSSKDYAAYLNYYGDKAQKIVPDFNEKLANDAIQVVVPSRDGSVLFEGIGRTIRLVNADTVDTLARFVGGHTGDIRALAVSADGGLLVSGAQDGSVRVWNVAERREVAALIALGGTDFVTVTPDQYYRSSKSGLQGVSFRVADRLYPFEQFDLHSNRPDIILERLGRVSNEEIQSYHRAYERRLKKMGFTQSMLSGEFHLPTAKITSPEPPATTDAKTLKLRVSAADDKFALDRINVFVNGVPVFGTGGLPVANGTSQAFEREVEVPLVPGKNMIQVSALNSQGAESLKQTLYTQHSAESAPGDVYIVAIGVSKYRDRAYDLRFAAKDAQDLIDAYTQATGGAHGHVHVLDLMNERATRDGIRAAKDWLKQSQPNDLAIVFAAGHGMMNDQQDYFFGTYDIDPNEPQVSGLPYDDFEALLDGIRALKKVLLIDTCFSGEIDKDTPTLVSQSNAGGAGIVNMRSFKAARGITIAPDAATSPSAPAAPSLSDNVDYFQDLFADLRRGTGAVVISSASGNEYAMEGETWRNGVFTYALLSGLKGGKADANHDGVVTVGELQAYVIDEVRKLTAGGQNPTVRRENLDFDFAVF